VFGRKARRIRELEAMVEADAVKLNRVADQTAALRRRVVGQRQQLREQAVALRENRQLPREAADAARLVIAGWGQDWVPAARHDGNHPAGECDACDAFRGLERFATRPWHRVIRAAMARSPHA
jgi:hypothetical protein